MKDVQRLEFAMFSLASRLKDKDSKILSHQAWESDYGRSRLGEVTFSTKDGDSYNLVVRAMRLTSGVCKGCVYYVMTLWNATNVCLAQDDRICDVHEMNDIYRSCIRFLKEQKVIG